MAAQHPLGVAALRLRNAAPESFDEFVQTLEAHTDAATVAVTLASQDQILVIQGRAQALRHMLQIFKECHLPHSQKPTP